MKKILLVAVMLLPLLCFAQTQMIQKTALGYKCYDKSSNQYVLSKKFISQYGKVKFIELAKEDLKNGFLTQKEYDKVLSSLNPQKKSVFQEKPSVQAPFAPKVPKAPIKIRTANLAIGTSIIGASFAAYAMIVAGNNKKINDISSRQSAEMLNYNEEVARLGRLVSSGGISQSQYLARVRVAEDQMRVKLNDLNEEIEHKQKSSRNAAYICGATSLVGVVTILTGLHRDKNGIKIAEHTYINSSSNGIGAAVVF